MKAELIDALRNRVTSAVGVRDRVAAVRAHEEKPQLGITTCLGPGRCMILHADKEPVICPFCVPFQGSSKDVDEHVKRVVSGN
jgi:hypothetical protein